MTAERGSAAVLALAMSVVVVLAAIAAVDVGALVVARSRAQSAADLAALAALTPDEAPPEAVAAAVADANGARLEVCSCQALEAVVEVRRAVRLLPAGPSFQLAGRARAVARVIPLAQAATPGSAPGGSRSPSGAGDRSRVVTASVRVLLASPRLELSPNARADLAAGVVDRRLVALLAAILRWHRVAVSVFRTGHSRFVAGTRRVSKHISGRAMDIYRVDGGLVRAGHRPSRAVVSWLNGLTGASRPSEVGSPFAEFESARGHFHDRHHLDHLHIAVG